MTSFVHHRAAVEAQDIKLVRGAGSVAEWLSGLGFGSWARTWHRSSGHVEAASHIPQLEGPATKIYNCVRGAVWGDKAEKKKRN